MMKFKDFPDAITIGRLKNGAFRYSIRYIKENDIRQSTKSYRTPNAAWKAASKAMIAKANNQINFIQ